jgi:allophanate hydrolase subunit 1
VRLLPVGDVAILVELTGTAEVIALHAALEGTRPPWIDDLVPAEHTLLVRFDPGAAGSADATDWIRRAAAAAAPGPGSTGPGSTGPGGTESRPVTGTELCVVVRYDGEDLDDVGRLTGLGPAGVVAAHTGTGWTVAFTGFAPGFGYLVGGDPRLRVPRLATPRVRVPAGSVALAGDYSGVYPRASPGGWRLIGRTEAPVWDLDRAPPALLRPGVRVRFVDASAC